MNKFETMVENCGNLVFSVCLRITGDYFEAQDLAQDTFLAAFKSMHKFEGGSEKAWLCRIATNKCLDWLKKKKPVLLDEESEQITEIKDSVSTPEEDYIQRETYERLKIICMSLKKPYRDIAVMHFIEGLSIAEISQKTNSPPNTVRTHIFRARKQLQKLWKEET